MYIFRSYSEDKSLHNEFTALFKDSSVETLVGCMVRLARVLVFGIISVYRPRQTVVKNGEEHILTCRLFRAVLKIGKGQVKISMSDLIWGEHLTSSSTEARDIEWSGNYPPTHTLVPALQTFDQCILEFLSGIDAYSLYHVGVFRFLYSRTAGSICLNVLKTNCFN